MLASAIARHGLPPSAFWRLGLREWRAINGLDDIAPPSRARIAELERLYPDDGEAG
jgi:hypothetical protein